MFRACVILFCFLSMSACTLTSPKKASMSAEGANKLESILAQQDDAHKARYEFRNPQQTLSFFEVEPGMTVLEVLPGGGWYSKILVPYLGSEGHLIGVDYSIDMFPNFSWVSPEFLAERKNWGENWEKSALDWGEDRAAVTGTAFGVLKDDIEGTVDRVLFIRAMHNLARFEEQGSYLSSALDNVYKTLKPGGLVGIVQHAVDESVSNAFADGSRGYLKTSYIKEKMRMAGFEYVDSSEINLNPKDKPGTDEVVWRLPPSNSGTEEGSEARKKFQAIGESNRVTLKFRKPNS